MNLWQKIMKLDPVKTISEKVFSIMDPNNTSCYNFVECFKLQFKSECVAVEQPTLLFRADTPDFEVKLGDYSNVFTNENFREEPLSSKYRINTSYCIL